MGRPSSERHGNWIAGEWKESRSGNTFVVDPPWLEAAPGHEHWPRSGQADVGEALEAARRSEERWGRLHSADRHARVDALVRGVHDSLDLELATLLDLEDEDLATHARKLQPAKRVDSSPSQGGLTLHLPDWRQLFTGFEACLEDLRAGRVAIVLSDAAVPHLARTLARAAQAVELPPGVLTVLHDDGLTTLRALVVSGELAELRAAGDPARLAESHELAARAPAKTESSGFGAGLGLASSAESAGVRFVAEPIFARAACIDPERGLEREIERVVDGGLSRHAALDGVAAGQLGTLLCPERWFSEFTALLLQRVRDEEPTLAGPLGLDAGLLASLGQATERGLDEGATLLQGGLEGPSEAQEGLGDPSGGFIPEAEGAILVPTIFTNVEEPMQLVRARRPAPLLSLMRVPSREAGEALATRLNALRGF